MVETDTQLLGTPSVIASHVDVIYQVYGAKRIGTVAKAGKSHRFAEMVRAKSPHIAAVREVQAIRDVSFIANHGESIAIIGRNGSGKSTLLRALAGLIPPSSGEVYHSGSAALLGVNAALMRELSGERNIMIGGQALGLTAAEVREKMPEIVKFAGLEEFIDLPMKAYSSGMMARLRFAISTAAVPDILMIDEALSTGDAAFRQSSKDKIAEVRERAGTVFLVSHNDRTVRSLCDRALWLENGQLVMDGPVDEVADAYQAERNRLRARRPQSKKVIEKENTGETSAERVPAANSPPESPNKPNQTEAS